VLECSRWIEWHRRLSTDAQRTRPVDFHSFRRAFKQGLAEADVDIQRAMKLSGATDMVTHARYLANTGKPAQIPADALPQLSMTHAQLEDPENTNQQDLRCRRADLNRRQRAYESGLGDGSSRKQPEPCGRHSGPWVPKPRDPRPPCRNSVLKLDPRGARFWLGLKLAPRGPWRPIVAMRLRPGTRVRVGQATTPTTTIRTESHGEEN